MFHLKRLYVSIQKTICFDTKDYMFRYKRLYVKAKVRESDRDAKMGARTDRGRMKINIIIHMFT